MVSSMVYPPLPNISAPSPPFKGPPPLKKKSSMCDSQTCYNKVYHIHNSLCASYIRVNPVKRNAETCIT